MNSMRQEGTIIIENNALFQLHVSRICLQTDYNIIIIIEKECKENKMDDGKWIKMIILSYGMKKNWMKKKKEERQLPDKELNEMKIYVGCQAKMEKWKKIIRTIRSKTKNKNEKKGIGTNELIEVRIFGTIWIPQLISFDCPSVHSHFYRNKTHSNQILVLSSSVSVQFSLFTVCFHLLSLLCNGNRFGSISFRFWSIPFHSIRYEWNVINGYLIEL